MKKISKILTVILAVLIASIAVGGCKIFDFSQGGNNNQQNQGAEISTHSVEFNTISQSERAEMSLVDAVDKVNRSAVAIKIGSARGSGVIVDVNKLDEDGNIIDTPNEFYIITCNHIIETGGELTVYLPDENGRNVGDDDYNTQYAFTGVIEAQKHTDKSITLVGSDKESDVAILKLNVSGSPVTADKIVKAPISPEGYKLRQGESVFAIGNPSGQLPMTVSSGIVSYLKRTVNISGIGEMVLDQIDLSSHHGSSGGGLFNMYGELVGITNSGSDEFVGLNYVIPFEITTGSRSGNGFINIAKHLIATENSYNFGYVEGRWSLGVTTAEYQGNPNAYVKVEGLTNVSNAKDAGIEVGDIVLKFIYRINGVENKIDITTNESLASAMSVMKTHFSLGDSFDIQIYRNGGAQTITINLVHQHIFMDTGVYPSAS